MFNMDNIKKSICNRWNSIKIENGNDIDKIYEESIKFAKRLNGWEAIYIFENLSLSFQEEELNTIQKK